MLAGTGGGGIGVVIALSIAVDSSLFTKRGHKVVMRRILTEEITEHKQRRLARHFERNADTAPGGGYGYTARTIKYQRRKAKKAGHQIPLVLSGKLRQTVLGSSRTTATSGRAKLYAKGYFPMRAQMRKEIENFSRVEISEIKAKSGLKYVAYAKKPEYQEIRRLRRR